MLMRLPEKVRKQYVSVVSMQHLLTDDDGGSYIRTNVTVLEPGTSGWLELRQYFGDVVFHPDGKVNRATLGEIVFNNIEKRKRLNAITHPRIQSAMIRMAVAYFFIGHSYIVMEVPLLFETGKMLSFMHKIITVVW